MPDDPADTPASGRAISLAAVRHEGACPTGLKMEDGVAVFAVESGSYSFTAN